MASWTSLPSPNLVKICHLKDQPLQKCLGKANPELSQTPLQEMVLQINHNPKPRDNMVRPKKPCSPQLTVKYQLEPSPISQGKNALSCPLTPSAVWQCQTVSSKIRVEVDRKTSQLQHRQPGVPNKDPCSNRTASDGGAAGSALLPSSSSRHSRCNQTGLMASFLP